MIAISQHPDLNGVCSYKHDIITDVYVLAASVEQRVCFLRTSFERCMFYKHNIFTDMNV